MTIVSGPNISYHMTTATAWKKIQVEGLIPQIGPRSTLINETEPAVYMFRQLDDAVDGILNYLLDYFDDDETLVLLAINTEGLQLHKNVAEYLCKETITPDKISLIEDFKIDVDE